MNSTTETITKMIESLPESLHDRVLDEIKRIVSESVDEAQWQKQFELKQENLTALAKRVKGEIAAGEAKPMDYGKL